MKRAKAKPEKRSSILSEKSFSLRVGNVELIRRVLSDPNLDVGETFVHKLGPSELTETRSILDDALGIDQISGKSFYVPLVVNNSRTNFSSTINLVGWSTMQRMFLHALTAKDVGLFQKFCSRLKNIDLEDRHCHHCGKVSDQLLHRCGICRIAPYCDRDCQKKDWKTGPRHANESHISHKMLHTVMLDIATFEDWYHVLEDRRKEKQ
jgi:hypothetical protein